MEIRQLEEKDIPSVIELGQAFLSTTALANHCKIDPLGFSQFILSADNIAVWVVEHENEIVGTAAITLFPLFFNPQKLVAQELFWYIREDKRGGIGIRLLNEMTDWAEQKEADYLFMIGLENEDKEMIDGLYKRMGFNPLESTYMRCL